MRELIAQADNRKLCTCDGDGRGPGRPCVVRAGERLGDLWRCARGLEAQAEQPAEPVAWHTPTLGFMLHSVVKQNGRRLGPSWIPLYAHPDPRIAALTGLLRDIQKRLEMDDEMWLRIEAALGGK